MSNLISESRSTSIGSQQAPVIPKPKILFIAPFPPPAAGVANVMQGFWDSSLHERFELHRFNITRQAPAAIRAKLYLENFVSTIAHWFQALGVCVRLRPQVINVVYTSAYAIVKALGFAIIGRICGAKVVGHLHGGIFDKYYERKSRFIQSLIRLALRPCAAWVVTATYWRDFMVSIKVDEAQITVIPNPQRKEVIEQPPKEDYEIRDGVPLLLFVGSVSYRKGVDILIKGLSSLNKEGGRFQAYILGGEENMGERNEFLSLALQYIPKPSIQFRERLDGQEYFDLLRRADIFVFPSRNENFPMALCEAMALGLPVICTPVGGVRDLVDDNENGLLISPGDPDDLVRAVIRLAGDAVLRKRLGQAGRDKVFSYLGLDRAAASLEKVLKSLCSSKPNGKRI